MDTKWTDMNYLIRNPNLFTYPQRVLIDGINTNEVIGDKYYYADYSCNAVALALSESPSSKMVDCGHKTKMNPSGRCTTRFWCPHCADRKAYNQLQELLLKYEPESFNFLTIGFDKPLTEESSAFGNNIKLLTQALEKAVAHYTDKGPWRGSSTIVEIAVGGFLPLLIRPHMHAIIHADSVDIEDVLRLEELIYKYASELLLKLDLTPRVQIDPIVDQGHFYSVLRYMRKHIRIRDKYNTAWHLNVLTDESKAVELNSEVLSLISNVESAFNEVILSKRFGTLQANNTNYVGIKRKDVLKHKAELKELIDSIHARPVYMLPPQWA